MTAAIPFHHDQDCDAIGAFRQAISEVGLKPPEMILADGVLHRFASDGRRGDDAGWYVLHKDGIPAGAFGCWRRDIRRNWQQPLERSLTTSEEADQRTRISAARALAEAEKAKVQAEAAKGAARIWVDALPASEDHPYLVKKSIKVHGVRQRGQTLVVPVRVGSELHSLQYIELDGTKRFLRGGHVAGGYFSIGTTEGAARLCIVEGFATGATVHEATGYPVAIAFNAGNLQSVVKTLHERFPDLPLIVCGDDDSTVQGNPGRSKATEAAQAVGGLLTPPMSESDRSERVTDFNDLASRHGLDTVRQAIEAAERPAHEWSEPQPLLAAQLEPEPYPLDALPATIQAAVSEVQRFVQAPVPLVSSSALGALSLAIQPHYDVQRAEKLTGPVGLWFLTIADSGERKSTCDTFFTEAIRAYEAKTAEAAKPDLKKYEANKAAWDARQAGVKDKIKTDTKAGNSTTDHEQRLRDLKDEEPLAPRVPKPLLGDETPENLAWVLSHEWPSGGVISSEAGIVFGAHGMGRDSIMRNLGLLNILWDGGVHSVGRRTSESFTVRGTRLTMALQVQEATLRGFFDRSGGLARGTGFLARFLVAWPESTQGFRPFADPPEAWPALAAFNLRIGEILDQPVAIGDDEALTPSLLALTPAAKRAWVTFHDAIDSELRRSGELYDVRDVASKAADNAARMAALFQAFEPGPVGAVGREAIEAASRIVAWHLNEARRFFGELALPEELMGAARLDCWLLTYCRENQTSVVLRRDVQRLVTPVSLRKKDALNSALLGLVEAGRVREVDEGQRKTIHINPALIKRTGE
jgi:putative DNA primase/helicase